MRVRIVVLVLGCLLPLLVGAAAQPKVYVATLDDKIINPVVSEYLMRALRQAERGEAECLVIELDTPGGLLSSTRTIVKAILNAQIPVVVYIYPSGSRAASAGLFVTLASHVAAMAPSTNIGAAHPVTLGSPLPGQRPDKDERLPKLKDLLTSPGLGKEEGKKSLSAEEVMAEKVINDTAAWVRTIAIFRGRNHEWAERAVRESLSVTEKEALEENVVDLIAEGETDLLEKLNGREVSIGERKVTLNTQNARLVRLEFSGRDELLYYIVHPNIAYILMALGFAGLLFEITHPGFGIPGIAGLLCLIVGAYAFQLFSVNFAALLLILLGLVLLVVEVKVPGFGIFALGAIISMVLGSLMLIKAPPPFMGVSLGVIIPVVAAVAAVAIFLLSLVIRSHRRKVATGSQGIVGEIGTVQVALNPRGKVFVHGEIWNAWSDELVEVGEEVRVIAVEGMVLKVEKLKQ